MKEILSIVTVFACFVCIQSEVPSYIKICGRRNPDLDNCIKQSVETIRPKLKEGIPELGVPSADPFFLPEGLPLTKSNDISASATNIKLWNMTQFELKSLHVNLEKKQIDFDVFFRIIKLKGDYKFDAKIVVPLSGTGPIEIEAENTSGKGSLFFQVVNTKRAKRIYFSSLKLKLEIGDYHSNFVSSEGPTAALNEAINSVLNENRQEIIAGILPTLEKVISAKILDLANRICKKFTYDELFPDRE